MRRLIVAAIFLIQCTSLFSQIRLEVAPTDSRLSTWNYQITGVLDSAATALIGRVQVNGNLQQVRLEGSIANYFTTLIKQSVDKNTDPAKVLLVIRKVSLNERQKNNFREGEVRLDVAFLSVRGSDTTFLTKTFAQTGYQRTEGGSPTKNLEKLLAKNLFTTINFFNSWLKINRSIIPAFAVYSQIIITPPYVQNNADTVYHPTRQIVWDDFRGSPGLGSGRYAAAIFASIGYILEMTVREQIIIVKFTPKVYMVKGMSWVRATNQNSYSLKHEQTHFDIAQIAMNRYINRVKTINESTPEDVQSRIQYEYIEAYREMNRLQDAYDDETGHGVYVTLQREWEKKVQKWLTE